MTTSQLNSFYHTPPPTSKPTHDPARVENRMQQRTSLGEIVHVAKVFAQSVELISILLEITTKVLKPEAFFYQ
eukprot:2794023-Amphidinium_carterae.1